MYRDDREALWDRIRVLEQELGAARGELDALRETLRVRDERYEALMAEADKMRGWLRGAGFSLRPFEKFLVATTPAFMLLSGGAFITGMLVVENGVAWLFGGMALASVVWVVRWLYTGET